MILLLTAYLIGYFISFGLVLGAEETFTFDSFIGAFMVSFFSWINIGIYLSGFISSKSKINEALTPKQSSDE